MKIWTQVSRHSCISTSNDLSVYDHGFLLVMCVLQVAASTQKEIDAQIPAYPNLPSQLLCQLHDVILHV